jgi:hypothetical protein
LFAERITAIATVLLVFAGCGPAQAQVDIRDLQKAKPTLVVAKPKSLSVMTKPQTDTAKEASQVLDEECEFGEVDIAVGELDQFLQEQVQGVGVFVDQRGLQVTSVDASERIQLKIPSMPLRAALRKMLHPLALKVAVEDEGLVITADYAELAQRGIATDRWADGESAADDAIMEKLGQSTSIAAVEIPLVDLISGMSEKNGIPMLIDKRALEEIGLSSEEPVSLQLQNVSLRSVLRLLLTELDLTYMVRDEVLKITTIEVAEMNLNNRIYFLEGLGGGPDDAADSVRNVIMATVVPDTWDLLGGPSVITPFAVESRPAIVVSATTDVHDQIKALLQSLRKAGSTDGPKVDGPVLNKRR